MSAEPDTFERATPETRATRESADACDTFDQAEDTWERKCESLEHQRDEARDDAAAISDVETRQG